MKEDAKLVGAVCVVGGGIAGMAASLDLAESGFKVYLVEKSPSIGGIMAQLDKTFPTNDCAMCTLAPRMIDTGNNLNIVKMPYSEIISVEGTPGKFRVKVLHKTRHIDPAKCSGCGDCAKACPVKEDSAFDRGLGERRAAYKPFAQALPGAYTIEKLDRPPCVLTCPAGVNVQAYVALIGEGKCKEAVDVIRKNLPFPRILGRICPHPCETECRRDLIEQPVSIAALKRFAGDSAPEFAPPAVEKKQEKIAVVGSGPAGLTCAYYLALEGYGVTVFEALPVVGGMLRVGIPAYRLPRNVLDEEIAPLKQLGVEIVTNTRIGKDITIDGIFEKGYKAVFLAAGCHAGLKLQIPGEDAKGVVNGVEFLRDFNLGKSVKVGKKVVVIGGGNVAFDSARTALRLGAESVTILYRRTKKEMPANEEEIEDAAREGIKMEFLTAPVEIVSPGGKASGIKMLRMKLGEVDSSGRRKPVPVKGSEYAVEADTIIPAIGQTLDESFLAGSSGVETKKGAAVVDSATLETGRKGVFAGGDMVSGPWIAIGAVNMGREAAVSISRFLKGEDLRAGRGKIAKPENPKYKSADKMPRKNRFEMKELPVSERIKHFKEIKLGLDEASAKAEANRCINCGVCCECFQCVTACEAKAVNHALCDRTEEFEAGAIIAAPGFEVFDHTAKSEYGFGRFKNVLSAIQFERLLSASGPTQGKVIRASDGAVPNKIAFIQCVGSRDNERNYCSSVCCMYATKEAVIAKEHERELECTIFYMDLRAHGKGFDAYYERAKEQGVKYVRCRPAEVEENPNTGNLSVKYFDEAGRKNEAEFDMVVLSTGIVPAAGAKEIADKLGIKLNCHGFASTDGASSTLSSPVAASKPGVFVCGPFAEPKDIPETVMEASAAAASAMGLLASEKGTLVTKKEYPPEKDVIGKTPRIGVFVCHCGKNIGGVVDVPSVAEYAKTLPDVVYATHNLYTCSSDTQDAIRKAIEENDLNRVIVASCTPRTHEPLFRDTVRTAGLNPYLFEMANIRDQCSWVHQNEHERATEKSKMLVRMAVAKARLLEPLKKGLVPVTQKALVIGGGMAGIAAALQIAEMGYDTFLVEKEAELGGNFRDVKNLIDGRDPKAILDDAIAKVTNHPKIKVFLNAKIKETTGFVGNFKTKVERGGRIEEFEHGVVIVAVGAKESKPAEYLYGSNPAVMTQKEFEAKIVSGEAPNSAVMIQCVGSRDDKRKYCSRICCQNAIKNALKVKELNPNADVTILYRDIRTYGFKEEYYTLAREKCVKFIRYEPERKPVVTEEGGALTVKVFEPILQKEITIGADAVVLSAAIEINPDAEEIAKMLKVPLNADGYFLEAHMKLRPVDFATDGVYMCGLAHAPKTFSESVSQALASASRAATILARDTLETEATISEVVDANCDGCAYCVDPCPFKALTLIEYMKDGSVKKTVERNESLCKGCGVCMATCPKKGIFVRNFKVEQIGAMVEAALQG
jgi:heterodisulfide reductase subunit A-like polyferredoxin